MKRIFIAILSGVLCALPIKANEPETVLRPTSPWSVHYSEYQCQLLRKFTDGPKETLFSLESGVTLNSGKIVLVIDQLTNRSRWTKASVYFGKSDNLKKYTASVFPSQPRGSTIWNIFGVDTDVFNATDKTEIFSVDFGTGEKMVFDLDGISEAFSAQTTCQKDLLEQYGFDLDSVASLQTTPKPLGNAGRWVTADSYPSNALRTNRQGTVVFQLTVNKRGKGDSCKILSSSGHKDLDRVVCAGMMRRARFEPALDKNGEVVSAPWVSSVDFAIPN